MTKSASPFSPVRLSVCLLALPLTGRAQQAASTPTASVEGAATEENKSEDASGSETEILASQGANFAAKDRIAVFTGDVRVKDPRFTLACDKLTVFLSKGAIPGAGPSPSPAASATPAPIAADAKGKDAERPGGIDHALAEGSVIIIQKRAPAKAGEEEKLTVGRADSVEYDNKTGDMTLRGMPKIEQNGNSTEALSKASFMVIGRDNSMRVTGPSRTHLIQRAKNADAPGSRPSGSPAANKRAPAAATQN